MGRKEIQEITVDGEIYLFAMLKPRVSLSLLTRLIGLIGPSLGKAFPNSIKIKELLDADINVGEAIIELTKKITYNEMQDIIDILFSQVSHKGEGQLSNGQAYDNLFTGSILHLFKVIKTALEVQYADFLQGRDALEAIIEKSKEMAS